MGQCLSSSKAPPQEAPAKAPPAEQPQQPHSLPDRPAGTGAVAGPPPGASDAAVPASNGCSSPTQQRGSTAVPQAPLASHPPEAPPPAASATTDDTLQPAVAANQPAAAGSAMPMNGTALPQAQAQQQQSQQQQSQQQRQTLQQPQQEQQQQEQDQLLDAQQPAKQWDRTAGVQGPPALAGGQHSRPHSTAGRSVKFADTAPGLGGASSAAPVSGDSTAPAVPSSSSGSSSRRGGVRRSVSSSSLRTSGGGVYEPSEAVLAKQAEILRSNKAGRLRMRRCGLDTSFAALQATLAQDAPPMEHVATRAAGLKHIGFGPFKRENQDEFFIQVGDFGGVPGGNLFCVFDGHGTYGKDAALYSRQLLPRLLDAELRKYFTRVGQDSEVALRGAVEVLLTEAFGDTERSIIKSGVNLASSGTTAAVAFQRGNRLWVAAAGDSRTILCTRNSRDQWRALPLTIDHRPRRNSERERIEAAGARVAPKRLPSGRSVGEPRLWLQDAGGPGLLLSRSLGDLTAATVGCTSDPEVTYTTLRPHTDHVLVMASDGVWDVLTNEQVCDIVVESPDPHIACRRVLDAALYEWEERMSADNISVLVVEFEWNEDGLSTAMDSAVASAFMPGDHALLQPQQQQQ